MKFKFFSVLLLTMFVNAAYALTVFDPANFAKNTITSIQTIQMEMRQYQQLMEMYRSNIATLKDGAFNNQLSNLNNIRRMYDSAQRLQGAVGNAQNVFTNAQAMYGAGNYNSWQDFSGLISRRKAAGESSAVNLVNSAEQAQKQMIEAQVAHSKLADSLSGVQGVTEASQATASAVGVLIGQNSAMIGMMSAQALENARNVSKKQVLETESETEVKNYLVRKNIELRRFNQGLPK